ncbi:ABC transporter permease [Pseudomonadota bacterium]
MKRYPKLLYLFFRYSLMRTMMYREDFITWTLVNTGWTVFTIMYYQILFLQVDTIAGWTKAQLLLLQGIFFIFESFVWGVFSDNFSQIPQKINQGTLDFDLVKPINTQFLLSFQRIGIDNFSSAFLGIFTILYSLKLGNIHPAPTHIVYAIFAIIIGLVFVYSTYFISMSISFWFDRFENLHFLYPSLREFWHNPHTFYKGALHFLLVVLTPIALITTIPTQLLLNEFPTALFFRLFLFSILSLLVSKLFFDIAIKKYSSASS